MSPDGPDFSLADVAREGLLEPRGAEPAPHDGTGRVDLAFTVHSWPRTAPRCRRPSAASGCRPG